MIDEFLFKNILKTFFKLEQNITRLWWLPPTHYYDSICCNFDFELGSNTKKKEEKRRNKKKEDKNTLGATGRRSEMTMLLHKSDIVIASYDLICILTSRLEIYLSLSTGIVSAHSYFTSVLNRDSCQTFFSNNVINSTNETNLLSKVPMRPIWKPFGQEEKQMGSNAGKPQINVHFYVISTLWTQWTRSKCRQNKSGKTSKNLNFV